MNNLPLKFLYLFLISCLFLSCEPEKRKQENRPIKKEVDQEVTGKEKATTIKNIFVSLPSPLELSMLFKKEGVEYYFEKLHSLEEQERYVTTVKKGLNLGVYGADLSYSGLFGKHNDAIQYFSVSQIIAGDLGIGETFQKEFITRLENNANNKDTLLQVISDFFLENDAYLKDQNQQNISTFILIGGWVEGLYLGIHMISEKTNAKGVREIIIGQLSSLDNLLILLTDVGKSQQMSQMKLNLELLRALFDEVKYSESKNPSSDTLNGQLVIDRGTGVPDMSDSTFNKIKDIVTEIRTSIIR